MQKPGLCVAGLAALLWLSPAAYAGPVETEQRASQTIVLAQASKKQPATRQGKALGPKADRAAWQRVTQVNSCAAYHHYLRTFPKGRYVNAALKALRNCRPRRERYIGRSNSYFTFYPPDLDPIWPWVTIPVPPIVVLPPEVIDPGPEPELPIAPEPELPEQLPLPEVPEQLPAPEALPGVNDGGGGFGGGVDGDGFEGGGFDGGGFDDGGFDDGGFDEGGLD